VSLPVAPSLRRGEAALAAGEEVLAEMIKEGRVRTVDQVAHARVVILGAVEEANAREAEEIDRRERAQHWRDELPDVAEAMLARSPSREVPFWRERLSEMAAR
jgi:hypothetical protein